MLSISDWIIHLKNPLVLVGFTIFILALILKPILSRISGIASERILSKVINLGFVLSVLIIVSGFVNSIALVNKSVPPRVAVKPSSSGSLTSIPKMNKEETNIPVSIHTDCDSNQVMNNVKAGRNVSQNLKGVKRSCQSMNDIEAKQDVIQKARARNNNATVNQSMRNIDAGGSVEQSN